MSHPGERRGSGMIQKPPPALAGSSIGADEETKEKCPVCHQGMVPHEVAKTVRIEDAGDGPAETVPPPKTGNDAP